MSLFKAVFNPFVHPTAGTRHLFESVADSTQTGSTIASSIDKWRAGGGGSREKLNGFKEAFQDQLPAVATPMTLDEMIKQYWVYGAVAVVGIIVLSKATK